MYWLHVARKDFADAIRSKMFWALSALVLILAYLGMLVPWALDGSDASASDGVEVLGGVTGFLIPIVALVVGYMAIVGERETGSVRMVLSLPLKRWEVLVGKLVGRTAVVVVPILLGFALAVPFAFALYGDLPGTEFVEFVTGVALVGAAFVAIAVGVSGGVASRGKALGAVVGIYATFEFLWDTIPLGLYYALNRDLPGTDLPTWFEAIAGATPTQAALRTSEGLYNGISTGDPVVLQEWVGALLLLFWMGIPLAVGYVRFEAADIN